MDIGNACLSGFFIGGTLNYEIEEIHALCDMELHQKYTLHNLDYSLFWTYFTNEELPYLNGDYGVNAHRYASDRRSRRRKLIRLEELRAHVVAQLKIGWTPEQIAGRLGYDGQPVRVSHETIYAYVYSCEGQSEQLARHLPGRRKKRQPEQTRASIPAPRYPTRGALSLSADCCAIAFRAMNRNMKAICDRSNGTPTKGLGWRTPTEAFREAFREEMMKLRQPKPSQQPLSHQATSRLLVIFQVKAEAL